MNPREQGDIGERAAAAWLLTEGACVAYPFGHSPDWDLVAEIDGTLYRVQVKTSTCYRRDRWIVMTCTHGGNRSWNGAIKRLDCTRCDYLFVLVGDGVSGSSPPMRSGEVAQSCSAARSTPDSRSIAVDPSRTACENQTHDVESS